MKSPGGPLPARTGAIIIFVILCAVSVSCRKREAAPATRQPTISEMVQASSKGFLSSPLLTTKKEIYDRRSALQDQILREFDQCPLCVVRKYTGSQRTFLFDAVTDCETTIRVGNVFDGGKWLCDPQSLPRPSIVYSFGVGRNISFDMDMARLFGSEVYLFDPSPEVVANFSDFQSGQSCGRGHLYYQPTGLGPVSKDERNQWRLVIDGKQCPVKSLAEIALSLHHDHVDILKIDIEGGEFAALLQELSSQTLLSLDVGQLLVEFHLWNDDCFEDFVRIIGALKKQGFLLFRKEFNPYAAEKCAEFAFVRRTSQTGAAPLISR